VDFFNTVNSLERQALRLALVMRPLICSRVAITHKDRRESRDLAPTSPRFGDLRQ
jgi:hypothetical protein